MEPDERIINPKPREEDLTIEQNLRPTGFAEYVGQQKVKDNLAISVKAARERNEALDHVLLYGPPGLGKTTLAQIVANEMGSAFKSTSGPVIERPGDLAALLTNLKEHDVLFIDEIHRLNHVVEEVLYPALEDYSLDILIGQGPSAKSIKMQLHPFTLIGATTRAGLLTSPLRDRFGMIHRLDFYGADELCRIVERSARILGIDISSDGAAEIARRARGTPRVANRLLRRVRDYAQVMGNGSIDGDIADKALEMLEVDRKGFDKMDRKLLLTIIEKFHGGPVGVETLAAAVSEEKDTIEDVYEPFLIQEGFLNRTARGRVATPHAYVHLGLKPDSHTGDQQNLFHQP